jgi:hypothetical protein
VFAEHCAQASVSKSPRNSGFHSQVPRSQGPKGASGIVAMSKPRTSPSRSSRIGVKQKELQ